jgi:outer membrane protein assembly factor BamE (lipoprotein component of BamABCDE complex)
MDRTEPNANGIGALAALALLAAGIGACTPVRDQHGFAAASDEQKKVEVGVDTKTTILARLGTPSTQSVFDDTAWYYLSTTTERFAFYRPRTSEREVIMISFGADDKVSAVETFGVEKGRVISYSDKTTPTRGRELGVLEQIFGNIGSSSPIAREDETRGGRR